MSDSTIVTSNEKTQAFLHYVVILYNLFSVFSKSGQISRVGTYPRVDGVVYP